MSVAVATLPRERLTPHERLEVLCDPGTLQPLRTRVLSRRMAEQARDGDGVLGASGRVDGRAGRRVRAGRHVRRAARSARSTPNTVVAVLALAERARIPTIGCIESAGARMQEGLAALAGYGRIFRAHVALSGVVPQISVICGACAGGGSYAPALTDFVVMTRAGEHVPHRTRRRRAGDRRGGRRGGARRTACARAQRRLPPRRADRLRRARCSPRDLLDHLPQSADERPIALAGRGSAPGVAPDLSVPAQERSVYDVRDVARALVDGGRLLEISPRYARNVVCAFARLDGRSIGIVANQPRYLGGVLDVEPPRRRLRGSCARATCSASRCSCSSTRPGSCRATRQERDGVIRHGAKLVHAFAECTVPRVTVVLRKGSAARVHRDEQQAPRRRLRVRVAARAARRDGRDAGGRDRRPARDRRRRGPAGDAGGAGRRVRRASTCTPTRPRPRASSTRSSRRAQTRARVAGAFATLEQSAWHAPAGGNIPL